MHLFVLNLRVRIDPLNIDHSAKMQSFRYDFRLFMLILRIIQTASQCWLLAAAAVVCGTRPGFVCRNVPRRSARLLLTADDPSPAPSFPN